MLCPLSSFQLSMQVHKKGCGIEVVLLHATWLCMPSPRGPKCNLPSPLGPTACTPLISLSTAAPATHLVTSGSSAQRVRPCRRCRALRLPAAGPHRSCCPCCWLPLQRPWSAPASAWERCQQWTAHGHPPLVAAVEGGIRKRAPPRMFVSNALLQKTPEAAVAV